MAKKQDMPVYLFTGFLEAGKTRFIQETLEDKRFCNGEKTLLLLCEEGEEEYAPDEFASKTVQIRTLEDQSELTPDRLMALAEETDAERVVIEYNGMWLLDALYTALPEGWMVYQEFFFADANTILRYNDNMRQLVYDKLKSCELAVFNRFRPEMDKMAFHKLVRALVPRPVGGAEEVRRENRALQMPRPGAAEAALRDLCRGTARDDLLRGGYPVCRPRVPVEGCQNHPGRHLDDPDGENQLQVQPRLRKARPGAVLSGCRALRGSGAAGCNLLLR